MIHNRVDGVVNFMRNWLDYKHGFGNLATEFWMGLEKMHMITNQGVVSPSRTLLLGNSPTFLLTPVE